MLSVCERRVNSGSGFLRQHVGVVRAHRQTGNSRYALRVIRMASSRSAFAARVLTVDSAQPPLEDLAEELRWSGYLVKSVQSAHEAILIARGFLPDLVIADVALPSLDGLLAAVEIKEWDPQCEILLLSDCGVAADEVRFIEAGGYSFLLIAKPANAAALRRQIDGIFGAMWHSRRAS